MAGDGRGAPWRDLTDRIKDALRGDGPLDEGLRESLGGAYGERVLRGGASEATLWVGLSEMPAPQRRSMVDHAEVIEASLGGGGGPPANPRKIRVDMSRGTAEMRVSNWDYWERATGSDIRARNGNIVRAVARHARDGAIRRAEEIVCGQFCRVTQEGSLRHVCAGGKAREDVRPSDRIRHRDIASAARLLAGPGGDPPGGLWALVSPEQERSLGEERQGGPERGAGGIDIVACEAIVDAGDRRHAALVAARGAVKVAMGGMELKIARYGDGVRLGARFALGAALDPDMSACVVSGAARRN